MPLLTRISCLSDGAFLVELYKNRSLLKTAEVRVGRLYTVEPPNPQKRKHRGRTCIVLDFLRDKKLGHPFGVVVRFLDSNRRGNVDSLNELVPVDAH